MTDFPNNTDTRAASSAKAGGAPNVAASPAAPLRNADFMQLYCFAMIAEQGSFTAAAEATGFARSTLSEHLKVLERRLKVRLIQRTTRRLGLTEEGQRLLAYILPLLRSISAAPQVIAPQLGPIEGRLRIAVHRMLLTYQLRPLILEFCAKHPKIQIRVTGVDLVNDLDVASYDAAMSVHGESALNTKMAKDLLRARLNLTSVSLKLVATSGYLKKAPPIDRPEDLALHDCLIFEPTRLAHESSAPSPSKWWFSRGAAEIAVPLSGRMVSNDEGTLLAAARAGLGIYFAPSILVRADLKSGRLQEVLPSWSTPVYKAYLYTASPDHSPALSALISFVKQASAPMVGRE